MCTITIVPKCIHNQELIDILSEGQPEEKNKSFSFSSDETDLFHSILSTLDVNEATKTYLLAEKFGNTHFREFQKLAIDAVLGKKNILVIQPTGRRKSLWYQYPAVYTGKTVVVTPTMSLMHDQTSELTKKKRINAVLLGSAQHDPNAAEKALEVADPASVVFVSPELLFGREEICKKLNHFMQMVNLD